MDSKKILGLDLGTNSIGWALIDSDLGKIKGMGIRIIPMDQKDLGKFDSGRPHDSQTAERTKSRGTRRLYQRSNLRRERLHRILKILKFLPEHYQNAIDFEEKLGQFKKDVAETKINYRKNDEGKYEFLFLDSYLEMLIDFNPNVKKEHLEAYCKMLKSKQKKNFKDKHKINSVPQDWTIYYLRKKALEKKISKEELAWLLLNFNTKRGYYQERKGIDDKEVKEDGKKKIFETLKVDKIVDSGEKIKGTENILYDVYFENGWKYDKQITKIENWEKGKEKHFIVTISKTKDGETKRTFRNVKSEDWEAIAKKTEDDIKASKKEVGVFIYESLLKNPQQKIKGGLVRHIDRKFWKDELKAILKKQCEFHSELQDEKLYKKCVQKLYSKNEPHQKNIKEKGFEYLFLEDIIFYHRPLKSKKSLIGDCQYEKLRTFKRKNKKTGKEEEVTEYKKATPKSNPLFIEFRLWQFLHNLKIYEINGGKDSDITKKCLPNEQAYIALFDSLNDKKEVEQKIIIKHFTEEKILERVKKGADEKYRWNYPSDKKYPMNPTRSQFLAKLTKANVPTEFLSKEIEQNLWHIFYSVTDKIQLKKALEKFAKKHAKKHNLDVESFVEHFKKIPKYPSQYGSYSEKAIKKLLPLMRVGKYWKEADVLDETKQKIDSIIERLKAIDFDENKIDDSVADDDVPSQVLKSFIPFKNKNPLKGLNTYQACYAVYDRHSEVSDIKQWKKPEDIDEYLNAFKQHSLRNPIVEQIVLETLRTVRDIWKQELEKDKDFKFDEIHLELGRKMKNSAEQREKISDKQNENEQTNKRVYELLKELKGANPHSPSHQEKMKLYEEGVYKNPDVSWDKLPENDVNTIRKNNNPTKSEIQKYRLWLEQGYVSPYTGKIIPLSKLFSRDYEVDHIIPQSRYFDDSLNNKVICESAVNNDKGNLLAYSEWLDKKGGSIVNLGNNQNVTLLKKDEYKSHCEKYFKKNRLKLKNLLAEEIPDGFINRQMNDSRYIAKLIKGLLGNIVREENELEATPKKLIPVTGAITSKLKKDWGLNEKWNELIKPRFERMNKLTGTKDFGFLDRKKDDKGNPTGKEFFRCQIPDESPQVKKKRIDHRHHVLDALVIACCTRDHINYLTSLNTERKNYSLRDKLLIKSKSKEGDFTKHFKHPWKKFVADAKENLEKSVISFKQNLRVINKASNKHYKWVEDKNGEYKKELVKQKGDNWAIRKPLHEEFVFGKVFIKKKKGGEVMLSSYLQKPKRGNFDIKSYDLIIEEDIRERIKNLHKKYNGDLKQIKAHLKKQPIVIDGEKVHKIAVYEWTKKAVARRRNLVELTEKQLKSITDSGIRRILFKHLESYQDEKGKKDLKKAFGEEGVLALNKNIVQLNGGKFHHPIYKVRVYEEGSQFSLSEKTSNKSKKYVESAKGTNLFFAIYEKDEKRNYETIPLNKVIEHQKQEAEAHLPKSERTVIPIDKEKGDLLFYLSPNDLVYVPTDEEQNNPDLVDFENFTKEQIKRLFVVNDFSDTSCYFKPIHHAIGIAPKEVDLRESGKGSFDNKTASFEGKHIKSTCWKLKVDRLGNIVEVLYPKQ